MFDATVAGGVMAVCVFTVLRFQEDMVDALVGTANDGPADEAERR